MFQRLPWNKVKVNETDIFLILESFTLTVITLSMKKPTQLLKSGRGKTFAFQPPPLPHVNTTTITNEHWERYPAWHAHAIMLKLCYNDTTIHSQ